MSPAWTTGSSKRREVEGVAPEEHRLGEHPVPEGVEQLRGTDVGLVVAGRPHRRMVVGAADAGRPRGTQGDRGAAVPEQQVVGDRQPVEHQLPARRVRADGVPEHRHDVRLVDRDPVLDPVREPLGRPARRTRRSGRRCRGSASRPRPRAPGAGPSGRASPSAGSRARAARRRAARRSRAPPRWRAPSRSAARAATRSRSGSRPARGAPSGRGPRPCGGSGRTRRRRSSRPRCAPAGG